MIPEEDNFVRLPSSVSLSEHRFDLIESIKCDAISLCVCVLLVDDDLEMRLNLVYSILID
jgi:hypothetical protein